MSTRKTALLVCALCLMAIGLGGQRTPSTSTSPRLVAHTQQLEEEVRVFYFPKLIAWETGKPELAFTAVGVAGYAIDGLIKLVKHLIEEKAKDYEASFEGTSEITLRGVEDASPTVAVSSWSMESAGVFVMIRTVEDDDRSESLPDLTKQDVRASLASEIKSLVDGVFESDAYMPAGAAGGQPAADGLQTKIEKQLAALSEEEAGERLCFAAVGAVLPNFVLDKHGGPIDNTTFRLALLGYRYSAFKADTLRGWGGGLDKTKSVLSVQLKGPVADVVYGGGRFEVAAVFPVSPGTRDEGWIRLELPKDNGSSKYVTHPIRVPSAYNLVLTMSVRETNNMKRTLEWLAEFVGEIELSPSDFGIE